MRTNLPPGIEIRKAGVAAATEKRTPVSTATTTPRLPPGFTLEKSVAGGGGGQQQLKQQQQQPPTTPRSLPPGISMSKQTFSNNLEKLRVCGGISILPSTETSTTTTTKPTNNSPSQTPNQQQQPLTSSSPATTVQTTTAQQQSSLGGEDEDESSSVKKYRPLVKHFDRNSESYGFDLARVKMEPGLLDSPTALSSYVRRSSPPPPPPPQQQQQQQQSQTKSQTQQPSSDSPSKPPEKEEPKNDDGRLQVSWPNCVCNA